MKILVVTDEVWNDDIHGNNMLQNWFEGFNADFANIYCSPGLPKNKCCKIYFQITDKMMVNSILYNEKAGKIRNIENDYAQKNEPYNSTDINGIGFARKYFGNILRLLKTIVWKYGKYDFDELSNFILSSKPDIIFSPRFATVKMLRLEKLVHDIAQCPIIAFTGDNEYSLRRFSFSPVFWFNLFVLRFELKKMMPLYSEYYTLSDEQKIEYEKAFSRNFKVLRKCGNFENIEFVEAIHNPIKLIYAGKMYCNRWKILSLIGQCLRKINADDVKIVLHIYTKDKISSTQWKHLHDKRSIFIKGAISQDELTTIYQNADVALHVESFDRMNRLATRVSFSTKIIDCLASGCAVMAVAWKEHSGITYLKREDAAICVDHLKNLYNDISKLVINPNKIIEYKYKAKICVNKNHRRKNVQSILYNDFVTTIKTFDCGREDMIN